MGKSGILVFTCPVGFAKPHIERNEWRLIRSTNRSEALTDIVIWDRLWLVGPATKQKTPGHCRRCSANEQPAYYSTGGRFRSLPTRRLKNFSCICLTMSGLTFIRKKVKNSVTVSLENAVEDAPIASKSRTVSQRGSPYRCWQVTTGSIAHMEPSVKQRSAQATIVDNL